MAPRTTDGSEPESSNGAAAPFSPPSADELREAAVALSRWLVRPRVRLTLIGVVLLAIGGLFVSSSVWTLPLVIAGAAMVMTAWVGRRLDGGLAVEWGEEGAQIEFRAKIRPAESAPAALPERPAVGRRPAPPSAPEPELRDADVVEGEAHTVEIEVAELRALIAAAETAAEAEVVQTEAWARAARNLRVAGGGARSSEAGPFT